MMAVVDEQNDRSNLQWLLIHHSTGGNFFIVMNDAARYQSTAPNENLVKGSEHTGTLISVLFTFWQFHMTFMANLQCRVIVMDQQVSKFL